MPSKLSLVTNAFRPGTEMDDPSLFAGREQQLREIATALNADGDCPMIYGHRGLGKSSLALQGQLIAAGERGLLVKQGDADLAIDNDTTYVSVYIACSDGIVNTKDILRRLTNGLLLYPQALSGRSSELRLAQSSTRLRVNAKIFEAEKAFVYEPRPELDLDKPSFDFEEQLLELVNHVWTNTGRRILFIIDELDRVKDTDGLASFIKASSSEHLKFFLVGIAHTVSELLADHQSLTRLQVPIAVTPMDHRELRLIIQRAVASLRDNGIALDFSDQAREALAVLAHGFPWFVHLIGREALLKVYRADLDTVEVGHIEEARRSLTSHRFAQQFRDTYQMAVRDSRYREIVLRSFAEWGDLDIPTADVYRVLRSELGVANPAIYLGHLCKSDHGSVFHRPKFQKRSVVRFSNDVFRVYVRIRTSIYIGVDNEVNEAWRRHRT